MKILEEFVVLGGYGRAFTVKANQYVTVTDLEGEQVVDFMAFCQPDAKEFLSMSRCRLGMRRNNFTVGDTLVTNFNNPMLAVVEDTFGIHDSTYAACDTAEHLRYGGTIDERTCQQNFKENLAPYGIEEWRIPDPWNLFQNTPDMNAIAAGEQGSELKHSCAGDYIMLKFLTDALVAVSACPFVLMGFNGGKATPIKITISE